MHPNEKHESEERKAPLAASVSIPLEPDPRPPSLWMNSDDYDDSDNAVMLFHAASSSPQSCSIERTERENS
jgi:hypothetical protein